MAIIPRVEGQENARMQANAPVPITDSGYAGVQGDALQALGDSISKFGQRQMEMSRELTRKETQVDMETCLRTPKKRRNLSL